MAMWHNITTPSNNETTLSILYIGDEFFLYHVPCDVRQGIVTISTTTTTTTTIIIIIIIIKIATNKKQQQQQQQQQQEQYCGHSYYYITESD